MPIHFSNSQTGKENVINQVSLVDLLNLEFSKNPLV